MFQIQSSYSDALRAKPGCHLPAVPPGYPTGAAHILEKLEEGRHIWVRRDRHTCDILSLTQASKQAKIIFNFL
jgi:hypothetical protein